LSDRYSRGRMADCHPKLRHWSKGLCQSCYQKERLREPRYREGRNTYNRIYNKEHRKRIGELSRASNLKRLYGITVEQYDKLSEKQSGGCFICGHKMETQRLHVDHDHKTGKVRGLLCYLCNVKVGWFEVHKGKVLKLLKAKEYSEMDHRYDLQAWN